MYYIIYIPVLLIDSCMYYVYIYGALNYDEHKYHVL